MTLREMQPRAGGFSFEREFKAINGATTIFSTFLVYGTLNSFHDRTTCSMSMGKFNFIVNICP
jgi:hypothetical protein